MKHLLVRSTSTAAIALCAVIACSSVSFGALNAYMKLKAKTGKTYTAKVSADGSFSFSNVQPGTYDLVLDCDDQNTNSQQAGKKKDKGSIEIESWSWGASNSGTTVKPPPSSNNQRKSGELTQADFDYKNQKMPKIQTGTKITLGDMSCSSGRCEKIIHRDLAIRNVCSPSGKVKIEALTVKQ